MNLKYGKSPRRDKGDIGGDLSNLLSGLCEKPCLLIMCGYATKGTLMPAKTLTTFLTVKPGHKEPLQCTLKAIANPMKADNAYLRFSDQTHFARLVVLPGQKSDIMYAGEEPLRETHGDPCDPTTNDPRPWRLMLNAVFDGTTQDFISAMVRLSPDLDAIFSHCEGYTGMDDCAAYLLRHQKSSQIFYDTFSGETVASIRAKADLREQIDNILDDHAGDVDAALSAIRQLEPIVINKPNLAGRAIVQVLLALVIVLGFLALFTAVSFAIVPVMGVMAVGVIVGGLAWVFGPALRVLFTKPQLSVYGAMEDQIDAMKAQTHYQASALTGREDVMVQNQFNLYLTFEGNWLVRHVRVVRQIVLMYALGRGVHINPTDGSLAGLTTVHFGNWVLIDGGRRLFFITNYDGSWENYISDFVNKIYPLLDVQLYNFVGFNAEGTRNITAFRRWLRRVQIQSDVFYSGYPLLTVRNSVRDLQINAALQAYRQSGNRADGLKLLKLFNAPQFPNANTREPDTRQTLIPGLTRDQWPDIQAFIVYGYARFLNGRYLFLHVEDPAKVKAWLAQVTPHITTVNQWDADETVGALQTAVNVAFTHAGFAALGLPQETLSSFVREFQEGIAPPPKGKDTDQDRLHPRSIILGDTGSSSPTQWTVGNPLKDPIHMVLMVSGATVNAIDTLLATAPFDAITNGQAGVRVLEKPQGGATAPTGREPFGFRDGISNPWIEGTRYSLRKADGTKGAPLKLHDVTITKQQGDGLPDRVVRMENNPVVRSGEFILGYPNEYGQLPPTPVIEAEDAPLPSLNGADAPEPLKPYKDFGRNGAYVVYRKLQQEVETFWEYMERQAKLAEDGEPDPFDMQRVAAKMIGRWPSGTPLVIAPDADSPELVQFVKEQRNVHIYNDFAYRQPDMDDSDGARCPFAAHIRRGNLRDGLLDDKPAESFKNNGTHRLIRRSVTFGKLADHQLDPAYFFIHGAPKTITHDLAGAYPEDEDGIGIHFWAVMANIAQQFEFVQQAWNNSPRFNGLFNSRDPITGDNPEDAELRMGEKEVNRYAEQGVTVVRHTPSDYVIPTDTVRDRVRDVPRFVHVKGGAYLFMPSIAAIRYLAESS